LALSVVYLQLEDMYLLKAFASSSFSSNTSNVVAEGNSTYSNSTQGVEQSVSKVIVIPNPASPPALSNDSIITNNTKNDLQNNESSIVSQDAINPLQNSNSNNSNNSNNSKSSNQNEMQRGEYKVDNNGIHYYNINNCSLVKGSSGIGDLSECEDAEREIQEELTG
jgi:hypothetical protein